MPTIIISLKLFCFVIVKYCTLRFTELNKNIIRLDKAAYNAENYGNLPSPFIIETKNCHQYTTKKAQLARKCRKSNKYNLKCWKNKSIYIFYLLKTNVLYLRFKSYSFTKNI